MTLRAVIIDDEVLARERLRQLLVAHTEQVRVVAEADGVEQAVASVNDFHPEILFLDIQMPGGGGFEVLSRIEPGPAVIFTTAHAEYAVRAFEEHALDYILKPIEPARLAIALYRVGDGSRRSTTESLAGLRELVATLIPRATPTSIPVLVAGRYLFVPLRSVSHFEARDKVVLLHTSDGGQFVVDHSLATLVRKLPANFVQVHRSFLVNTDFIREVSPFFRQRFGIHLDGQKRAAIKTGPSYAAAVRRTFGL
jgi:two-component system, LytTR family, response regulator